MAEQLIRNEQVVSSILTISSNPVNGYIPPFMGIFSIFLCAPLFHGGGGTYGIIKSVCFYNIFFRKSDLQQNVVIFI